MIPVSVHVHRIVGGGVRQQQRGRDDILALNGGEDRVSRHQVLHRRARRAARVNSLDDFQTFAANLERKLFRLDVFILEPMKEK